MIAIAYYRTSSSTNVGDDKDSRRRQEIAVHAYAGKAGYIITGEYYDADVRGDTSITARPGMSALIEDAREAGVQVVLVENASRFARDAIVQLTGYDMLKALGITIIPVDAPQHFLEDTPTARLVRGVLACVSEFEKAHLVARLRAARERKKAETGWCGGRRPISEAKQDEIVRMAKDGVGQQAIAAHFNVSQSSVSRVLRRRAYALATAGRSAAMEG